MRLFGRPQPEREPLPRDVEAGELPARLRAEATPPARGDSAPVLVAVDDSTSGWDALDWATAEAAARGSELRILHVIRWPVTVDLYSPVPVGLDDHGPYEAALHLLHQASQRAKTVAPEVPITLEVVAGSRAAHLIATRAAAHSVTVLGRPRHRSTPARLFSPRVAQAVLAHAGGPVVLVELRHTPPRDALEPTGRDPLSTSHGAGRVVVLARGPHVSRAALGFAVRSALRRGIGLAVLQVPAVDRSGETDAPGEVPIEQLRRTHPEVDLQRLVTAGRTGDGLKAEVNAAALVVVPGHRLQPSLWCRQRPWPPDLEGIHAPVAVVNVEATPRRRLRG